MADYAAWRKESVMLRVRAGCRTKEDLAKAFSKIVLSNSGQLNLSGNEISRYETDDKRVPRDRERHLALIECFVKLGALTTSSEANLWLDMAGQGHLSSTEQKNIFGETKTISRKQSGSARVLLTLDIDYDEFLEWREEFLQFLAHKGIEAEIARIMPGSVVLHLDVPPDQAIKLYGLFKSGQLEKYKAEEISLSGLDLSGMDLSNTDLSGADLSGADLRGANLTGANLRYADLSGADLTGANLHNADLTAANLTHASLISATLSEANLTQANLIFVEYNRETVWPEGFGFISEYTISPTTHSSYIGSPLPDWESSVSAAKGTPLAKPATDLATSSSAGQLRNRSQTRANRMQVEGRGIGAWLAARLTLVPSLAVAGAGLIVLLVLLILGPRLFRNLSSTRTGSSPVQTTEPQTANQVTPNAQAPSSTVEEATSAANATVNSGAWETPRLLAQRARVIITGGTATIQKADGKTEQLSGGVVEDALGPGDRLITHDSTARIEYFEGQTTTVDPGAVVELQEYIAQGDTTRVALLVYAGKTSHEVDKALAADDLFEVRTPAAIANVKQSKITIEALSATQTHIETQAGTAQIATGNQELVMAVGQQLTATLGVIPGVLPVTPVDSFGSSTATAMPTRSSTLIEFPTSAPIPTPIVGTFQTPKVTPPASTPTPTFIILPTATPLSTQPVSSTFRKNTSTIQSSEKLYTNSLSVAYAYIPGINDVPLCAMGIPHKSTHFGTYLRRR